MSLFYRIAALIVFAFCLICPLFGRTLPATYKLIGWAMIICAEICELKESL